MSCNKQVRKNLATLEEQHHLCNKAISDIDEFLIMPMFWLMKLIPDARRNINGNWSVNDVRTDLDKHQANPGCLTRGDTEFYSYDATHPVYTNFGDMRAKYKQGNYTDFETQARQIIAKDDANRAYVTQLADAIEKLHELMEFQAGFNPKLFGLDCTEKRNYLNEKNKPKCELCAIQVDKFGSLCKDNPEMRQTYQLIITEIIRISEENKHTHCPEYIELLRAINICRTWYVKPNQIGSRRGVY